MTDNQRISKKIQGFGDRPMVEVFDTEERKVTWKGFLSTFAALNKWKAAKRLGSDKYAETDDSIFVYGGKYIVSIIRYSAYKM